MEHWAGSLVGTKPKQRQPQTQGPQWTPHYIIRSLNSCSLFWMGQAHPSVPWEHFQCNFRVRLFSQVGIKCPYIWNFYLAWEAWKGCNFVELFKHNWSWSCAGVCANGGECNLLTLSFQEVEPHTEEERGRSSKHRWQCVLLTFGSTMALVFSEHQNIIFITGWKHRWQFGLFTFGSAWLSIRISPVN